jgi:GGDEF domain-containing protein
VADASQAYARIAGHAASREAEFLGVIRLLRELVDGLRGDAIAFRDDLLRSSERVADLMEIEDIRTLRRALNREVDQLRHCVQQGERREASRFAQVAGELRRVDESMGADAAGDTRHHTHALRPRAMLLGDLAASRAPAALLLCRIDEPEAIVDDHGAQVLERVIVALAHLLTGTFGDDAKVYRSSTECVAMFLPKTPARQLAQQVRKVQARVAPEYEYERTGVTRRVVFTFSAVVTMTAGKHERDALEALARAEANAGAGGGLSQLHVETSGFGRLAGWFSSK